MTKVPKGNVRRQAVGCALVVVAMVLATYVMRSRPASADKLTIPVSLLRSQAAELVVMQAQRHAISEEFVQAHLANLSKRIEDASDDLRTLNLRTGDLIEARDNALKDSRMLRNPILLRAALSDESKQTEIASERDKLIAIEEQLRRK